MDNFGFAATLIENRTDGPCASVKWSGMGDEVYAVVMMAAGGDWRVVQPSGPADDLRDFDFDPEAHFDPDAPDCVSGS
jgi:hypothetical protein